ncbi:hypothetical protein [Enterococcus gilvus]|uniref:hypothetical protein n=1 Tax=Enterococcus gilvus TaxID=160453 RepID=UPI0028D386B1|nr:hypothetical protein [Enterococcus gilvus]
MVRIVGLLEKIRIIKRSPMMARFTVTTIQKSYNCIVATPELVTVILMLVEGKYNVAVSGHFNKQKQLVVEDFTIRNPDQAAKDLGL